MILNIHIPAGWRERLAAEEGDRLMVLDNGAWVLYAPGNVKIRGCETVLSTHKRTLAEEEIEALRVVPEDCCTHTHAPDWKCEEWLRYGFARPDFLRWTAQGIFEPAIAAELRGAGIDPDRDSARLTMFAAALCDGDLSVAEFLKG